MSVYTRVVVGNKSTSSPSSSPSQQQPYTHNADKELLQFLRFMRAVCCSRCVCGAHSNGIIHLLLRKFTINKKLIHDFIHDTDGGMFNGLCSAYIAWLSMEKTGEFNNLWHSMKLVSVIVSCVFQNFPGFSDLSEATLPSSSSSTTIIDRFNTKQRAVLAVLYQSLIAQIGSEENTLVRHGLELNARARAIQRRQRERCGIPVESDDDSDELWPPLNSHMLWAEAPAGAFAVETSRARGGLTSTCVLAHDYDAPWYTVQGLITLAKLRERGGDMFATGCRDHLVATRGETTRNDWITLYGSSARMEDVNVIESSPHVTSVAVANMFMHVCEQLITTLACA